MVSIVRQASNVLLLVLLGIGAAHGASAPNKPYKVCPTRPQPKDFPCVAMKPTSTIAVRGVESNDSALDDVIEYKIIPVVPVDNETDLEKELKRLLIMKESENESLKKEVELLNQMVKDLMDREIKRQTNVTVPNQDEK